MPFLLRRPFDEIKGVLSGHCLHSQPAGKLSIVVFLFYHSAGVHWRFLTHFDASIAIMRQASYIKLRLDSRRRSWPDRTHNCREDSDRLQSKTGISLISATTVLSVELKDGTTSLLDSLKYSLSNHTSFHSTAP